jgi:molybdopterin-guanine dinucleotide biosynthesis protein A
MIGVILCGGQSLRMGQDKGLLISGTSGDVWAEIMRNKFSEVSMPSVLSINSLQKESYLRYFDQRYLVIDDPKLNIQGPVLGLLSTHLRYPNDDLMVLPCDMIKLNGVALQKLLSDYAVIRPPAIAYKADHVEPMCAIYSSSGLSRIISLLNQNEMAGSSMTHVLESLNALYISIPENWKLYFGNLNSPEDLS